MWHIKVPASSANLGSGLDTLGMALELWLECWFTPARALDIEVHGEGRGQVSLDETNLIWQSAESLHRAVAHQPMPRGHLIVSSQIPLGRGLGSSAAAVVAGLTLANACLEHPLGVDDLLQWAVAIEGHPDNVAAAVYGGLVMAWQNGARVEVHRYRPPELTTVLVIPQYEVSTSTARALLPERVSRHDAVFNAQRLGLWIDALWRRDWGLLKIAGQDRLHQPYRRALVHGMDAIIEAALAAGAVIATLSGSGPTILALAAPEEAVLVAAAIEAAILTIPDLSARIHLASPALAGAALLPDNLGLKQGC
ncbi:MAG: homoserine kinase [Thermaerobacter sp.]|nr:homoserine kinase [Thermaerobacter sp.]